MFLNHFQVAGEQIHPSSLSCIEVEPEIQMKGCIKGEKEIWILVLVPPLIIIPKFHLILEPRIPRYSVRNIFHWNSRRELKKARLYVPVKTQLSKAGIHSACIPIHDAAYVLGTSKKAMNLSDYGMALPTMQ